MTLKMCGKKTYDPSGFSPEIFFYLNKNWQKYWQLELCHFFFDHTVWIDKFVGSSFMCHKPLYDARKSNGFCFHDEKSHNRI